MKHASKQPRRGARWSVTDGRITVGEVVYRGGAGRGYVAKDQRGRRKTKQQANRAVNEASRKIFPTGADDKTEAPPKPNRMSLADLRAAALARKAVRS